MTGIDSSLSAKLLDVRVPGRMLVSGLECDIRPGELIALLGQNGSGKTLTLHTLAGLRQPASGQLILDGKPVDAWARRDFARRLGLLPQATDDLFPSTVMATAMIGRHPHVGWLRLESADDRRVALKALRRVDLESFAERDVTTLSGGERRRLAFAQLLAQAPVYWLLDEPTNHLDPQHQLQVMDLCRGLADEGMAVVASLHDVNLAARYADRVLALYGDGRWRLGPVSDMLTPEILSELYNVTVETGRWRNGPLFVAAGGNRETDR